MDNSRRNLSLFLLVLLLIGIGTPLATAARIKLEENSTTDIQQIVDERIEKGLIGKKPVVTLSRTIPTPTETAPDPTTSPTSLETAVSPTPTFTGAPIPTSTFPGSDPFSAFTEQLMETVYATTLLLTGLLLCGAAVHLPLVVLDHRRFIPGWRCRLRVPLSFCHGLMAILFLATAAIYLQSVLIRFPFVLEAPVLTIPGGFLLVYMAISSAGMSYAAYTDRRPYLVRWVHMVAAGLGLLIFFLAAGALQFLPLQALLFFPASMGLAAVQDLGAADPKNKAISPLSDTFLFEERGAPPAPRLPAELNGRYYDSHFLGQGGIARVFSARRREDGILVAVKIAKETDEQTGRSLLREMSVWQSLDHPSIVKVTSANILPIPYVEMEYLPRSLETEKVPMEPAKAALLVERVAQGLAFAHARGVIHRDLKPANILLDDKGEPRIADWGLSRDTTVPEGNTLVGFSLSHAAPEQLDPGRFGRTDERTDIYQLGAIFYQLLTGTLPFPGESVAEVTREILAGTLRLPSEFNPANRPLDPIVFKCMSRDPGDRYPDVNALLRDL
ncbi:MAG: serine/threonine protein kinase, partial [Methanolinea sp.]|nr:serine/threonine protein kinase [Methanolinea sp.]